jgi:hypothetical protein
LKLRSSKTATFWKRKLANAPQSDLGGFETLQLAAETYDAFLTMPEGEAFHTFCNRLARGPQPGKNGRLCMAAQSM